ncbi:MAG: SycD/LcrH family type III secretion system chaperone [Candidatus Algichlamydia australiensis]|nr:SycD/LcrH family type III secretion system chaperone [Chlamydiales bacterium]
METEILEKALDQIRSQIENGQPITPEFTNDDMALLYSLGHSLYKFGDYAQARKIFQHLILAQPYERKNWHAFACACQMTEHYKEALTGYSLSAMFDENDPVPHFHAGECLYSLGDFDEGERALRATEERLGDKAQHEELRGKIAMLRRSDDNTRPSQPTI